MTQTLGAGVGIGGMAGAIGGMRIAKTSRQYSGADGQLLDSILDCRFGVSGSTRVHPIAHTSAKGGSSRMSPCVGR